MRLLNRLLVVSVVAFVGGTSAGAVAGTTFIALVIGVTTSLSALVTYAWVARWTVRRALVAVV